ncbi:hypothetical protein MKW98_010171 [Papaver atlanticum]|uniref:SWIM-type domain-containing protein n=1 Tax=Papaver atlanticum TaxID=357466 RepID=A0AAD4X5F2_9MAGN|nr:hypothetical protein MKW98_010171 [Papaver atlanticum]
MKPLDAIERQIVNEGLNKQDVDPSRPVPGRKSPTRPVSDRMRRALHEDLRLLHRVEADFFILGSTGEVYNVRLSKIPSCNCPDCTIPCKHLLFELLRVLGIPHNDHCLNRKILRPYHLKRLLNTATSPATGSSDRIGQCEDELANEEEGYGEKGMKNADEVDSEDTSSEDEPYRDYELVRCWTCESVGHTECLVIWSKGRGLRGPTCSNCKRDWWMDSSKRSMYPNLAAYLDKD